MQYAMMIDYGYCSGCRTCEIACRKEKGIPLEEWGIKVFEAGPEKLGDAWEWDYLPVPSRLCDLCVDRIEAGSVPACQMHCLAQVIEVAPLDAIAKAMAEKETKVSCYLP